jgi:hypothetical protein
MPERFKDKINIPIAIPAWGLISTLVAVLVSGAYYGGGVVTKLDQLIDLGRETKQVQVAQQAQIDRINERQIGGLATQANHEQLLRSLDGRVSQLERRK